MTQAEREYWMKDPLVKSVVEIYYTLTPKEQEIAMKYFNHLVAERKKDETK